MQSLRKISFAAVCGVAVALTACGGGGGSSASTTSLVGTAAVGAPMANATVKLTDGDGKSSQTTAGSDGSYKFSDISQFKAPILVSATGTVNGAQVTYASVAITVNSGASNTTNVNPLTDVIVLQATGQSNATLAGNPALIKTIDAAKIKNSTDNVVSALSNVLEGIKAGSSAGFNPITSPTVANSIDPYDKVLDLISVGVNSQASGGTTTVNITLTDKSGTNGTVTIVSGTATVTKLPAVDATIAGLPFDKLPFLYTETTRISASAALLTTSAVGELLSDSYLRNGSNKAQRVAQLIDPNGSGYMKGYGASNPIVQSCNTSSVCLVTNNWTFNGVDKGQETQNIIWNQSKGIWQYYGNQQTGSLNVYWGSQVKLWASGGNASLKAGLDFGIRDSLGATPFKYNSATFTFQKSDGSPDYVINFKQKTECTPDLSYYNGMPIDDSTRNFGDNTCAQWVDISDILATKINDNISLGGYKVVVRAYLALDRTGAYDEWTQIVTKPLMVSTQVTEADFPKVTMTSDVTGPLLSIANAGDYVIQGSVCLSSASSPNHCDMVGKPSHTSEYKNNYNKPLQNIYRPVTGDGWISSEVIRSYFINVKDRFGRNLYVSDFK